jgi:hypothetical protein
MRRSTLSPGAPQNKSTTRDPSKDMHACNLVPHGSHFITQTLSAQPLIRKPHPFFSRANWSPPRVPCGTFVTFALTTSARLTSAEPWQHCICLNRSNFQRRWSLRHPIRSPISSQTDSTVILITGFVRLSARFVQIGFMGTPVHT